MQRSFPAGGARAVAPRFSPPPRSTYDREDRDASPQRQHLQETPPRLQRESPPHAHRARGDSAAAELRTPPKCSPPRRRTPSRNALGRSPSNRSPSTQARAQSSPAAGASRRRRCKPSWDFTSSDMTRYQLTTAEQLRQNLLRVSKHSDEAAALVRRKWRRMQENIQPYLADSLNDKDAASKKENPTPCFLSRVSTGRLPTKRSEVEGGSSASAPRIAHRPALAPWSGDCNFTHSKSIPAAGPGENGTRHVRSAAADASISTQPQYARLRRARPRVVDIGRHNAPRMDIGDHTELDSGHVSSSESDAELGIIEAEASKLEAQLAWWTSQTAMLDGAAKEVEQTMSQSTSWALQRENLREPRQREHLARELLFYRDDISQIKDNSSGSLQTESSDSKLHDDGENPLGNHGIGFGTADLCDGRVTGDSAHLDVRLAWWNEQATMLDLKQCAFEPSGVQQPGNNVSVGERVACEVRVPLKEGLDARLAWWREQAEKLGITGELGFGETEANATQSSDTVADRELYAASTEARCENNAGATVTAKSSGVNAARIRVACPRENDFLPTSWDVKDSIELVDNEREFDTDKYESQDEYELPCRTWELRAEETDLPNCGAIDSDFDKRVCLPTSSLPQVVWRVEDEARQGRHSEHLHATEPEPLFSRELPAANGRIPLAAPRGAKTQPLLLPFLQDWAAELAEPATTVSEPGKSMGSFSKHNHHLTDRSMGLTDETGIVANLKDPPASPAQAQEQFVMSPDGASSLSAATDRSPPQRRGNSSPKMEVRSFLELFNISAA